MNTCKNRRGSIKYTDQHCYDIAKFLSNIDQKCAAGKSVLYCTEL